MGRLDDGEPLPWYKIDGEVVSTLRADAISRFLAHVNWLEKDEKPATFGDELEYTIVKFEEGKVRLLLKSAELLDILPPCWMMEAAMYCVEGTPEKPYGIENLLQVETSLTRRRELVKSLLGDKEGILSLSAFPRFGCPGFTLPSTNSILGLISKTHRHQYIMKNLCLRDIGPKVHIPVFQDKLTETKSVEVDTYPIGILVHSFQLTIQASGFEECRYLYDQMAAMCPVFIALSAATPAFQGLLLESDSRVRLQTGETESSGLPCRVSAVRHYISHDSSSLNNVDFPLHEQSYQELTKVHGVNENLANHLAFRLNYHPVIVYEDNSHVDAAELMNGTVWQFVKLKIPDNDQHCWRVEVRPMDIQFTDFENAAMAIFVYLLSRAILHYGLDLRVPISCLIENVEAASNKNAILDEKFIFSCKSSSVTLEPRKLTMAEILNGNPDFPGLLHFIKNFVREELPLSSENGVDGDRHVVDYLDLVRDRAGGSSPTCARRMRDAILQHPSYAQDSVVSDVIQYDVIKRLL